MKSWPRWMIWTGATVALWFAWVTLVYMPLRQRGMQADASVAEWSTKEREMLSRIQSTPKMLEQLNELGAQIDSTTRAFPQSDLLKDYMEELTSLGRLTGIRSVEANPELLSMMALTKSNPRPEPMLDTLMIELTAVGGFQEIGMWLDQIESQTAFRGWKLGQWDKGPDPGTVRFVGAASFLITVPRGESS